MAASPSVVIPLSRAYYKLQQVCREHLLTPNGVDRYNLRQGGGCDLGKCLSFRYFHTLVGLVRNVHSLFCLSIVSDSIQPPRVDD